MTSPTSSAPAVASDRVVLAALLHRLGSPLGALVNYVHLADDGRHTDPLLRDAWAGIHSAIKDLRTALEGGRRWLNACDVEPSARKPLGDLVAAAASRVPQVTVRPSLQTPATMLVPAAIEDVLAELLANACQSGGATAVDVTVAPEATGNKLRLVVEDDGRGWPGDARERAFEPFRHLAAGGEAQSPGAGCGLAIVALTAAHLGGEAWGETRSDETGAQGGARVIVTFTVA